MARAKFKEEVKKAFSTLEAEVKSGPGLLDVLQLVDQVDPWIRSVNGYLAALKPTSEVTSASSTSIVSRPQEP